MRAILFLATIILAVNVSAQQPPRETNLMEETEHRQRAETRESRTERYMRQLDETIQGDEFSFRPNSFQLQPAGRNMWINNINYRMDFRKDYIDIYLPFPDGITPPYRMTVINYTIGYVDDYTVKQDDNAYVITFSARIYASYTYKFRLTVYRKTGTAELEITDNFNKTVSYSGGIQSVY